MNNIKQMRVERGMRQTELATLAGVSQPFLHDLENGNRNAKPETWERIAGALDCTIDELKEDSGSTQEERVGHELLSETHA